MTLTFGVIVNGMYFPYEMLIIKFCRKVFKLILIDGRLQRPYLLYEKNVRPFMLLPQILPWSDITQIILLRSSPFILLDHLTTQTVGSLFGTSKIDLVKIILKLLLNPSFFIIVNHHWLN